MSNVKIDQWSVEVDLKVLSWKERNSDEGVVYLKGRSKLLVVLSESVCPTLEVLIETVNWKEVSFVSESFNIIEIKTRKSVKKGQKNLEWQ